MSSFLPSLPGQKERAGTVRASRNGTNAAKIEKTVSVWFSKRESWLAADRHGKAFLKAHSPQSN
jgi:hypothetical protein